MSESEFQAACLKKFRVKARCQKFQDSLQKGIPDVLVGWRGGGIWIEMKWVEEWPRRPTTPPPVHFQPGQRPWLEVWFGMPLPTAVLIGSPQGWSLVPGNRMSMFDGPWTALSITPGVPDLDAILQSLKYQSSRPQN